MVGSPQGVHAPRIEWAPLAFLALVGTLGLYGIASVIGWGWTLGLAALAVVVRELIRAGKRYEAAQAELRQRMWESQMAQYHPERPYGKEQSA